MSDVGLFETLGLTEYEATALAELLRVGRTTAPNLAEATGIPKARIYGVLDSLADDGYLKVIPGRPKEYQPHDPETVLARAKENKRQEYESFERAVDEERDAFLSRFEPAFASAAGGVTPAEELFYVVDVGDPSESETRRLYHEAEREAYVLTKSFEYLDAVRPAIEDAIDRGVAVHALFYHPDLLDDAERRVQADVVDTIRTDLPAIDFRFATGPLPWRGTFVDPSMDYDGGEALFLVEEPDVPNHMRQAALTENGSFVAGFKRYFELVWDHESIGSRGDDRPGR
ncbi:TrmB family transcriptional regulator [Halosegnis marinus]|uniref:TrmB family transcriptional regulator n=1 Tax=Halosegnis marinus TaxID=3034023 RepID=A0ABD5ZKL1_9EURY|nr:helix-turn-helix domain-containing protein [Halosegnis sp. DT85]